MTIEDIAMATHDIQQAATSGKYAGCVYVTARDKVYVPRLGFFKQKAFDVVMGPGSWVEFTSGGPAWAHSPEFRGDWTGFNGPESTVFMDPTHGVRRVRADCVAGWF